MGNKHVYKITMNINSIYKAHHEINYNKYNIVIDKTNEFLNRWSMVEGEFISTMQPSQCHPHDAHGVTQGGDIYACFKGKYQN